MGSVMLGLNQEIKWPNYCVFCNKEAHDWSMTSSTKLLDFRYYFILIKYTTQTYNLTFPVCAKHKKICDLLCKPFDFLSLIGSLIIGFVLWLLFFVLFHLIFRLFGLETIAKDLIDTLPTIFAVGSVFFYYVYATFLHPIRILYWSENTIKIHIRNNKFFNDFKLHNIANIIE